MWVKQPGIRGFNWMPFDWMMIVIMVADGLWVNTLVANERKINLISIACFEKPGYGSTRIYSLVILWLSIRIGIRHKK